MPQLDFTTAASQIFWLVVSFCSIYTFVSIFFVPRVRNLVYSKKDYVQKIKDEAEAMSIRAKEIEDEIEKILFDAREESASIIANAKRESELLYNSRIKEVETEVLEMVKNEERYLSEQYSFDVKKLSKNISELRDFIMSKVSSSM